MKPFGSKSAIAFGMYIWDEHGLIQIWTERCPNEAIWKQTCNGFGKLYPDSKNGLIQIWTSK